MGTGGQTPHGEDAIGGVFSQAQLEAQCDQRFMKLTVGQIPNSASLAQQSGLPIGVVLRPLAPDEHGEDDIDVVDFGACGIIRCKRCRTYVNPFVQWLDNGRRWRCNLCGAANDCPSSYFCHLDADGQRRDKDQRPELNTGSVELVAPAEYMVRPPQAPVYMFVIDVSAQAISSGMLATCVETIKETLDSLPGAPRTQVGVITYDSTIHFYNLKSTLSQPQMMVVSPTQELFLPIPDDLLVNLSESRDVIDTLLDSLPSMFENTRNVETCFGSVLQAAFKVMAHIGGKMCIFQASLPSMGQGKLKHRENPRLFGTEKEHTLLDAEDPFYQHKVIVSGEEQCE
jgi:protein transport protein SEC24